MSATKEAVTVKRMKDGNRFVLPTASLCEDDQIYVANWIKRKADRLSREALDAAIDAEPDPELEAKIIDRLEIDIYDARAAVGILSKEIGDKEEQINALDAKIAAALRREDTTAGRQLQVEAIAINEELAALRGLRAEFENGTAKNGPE